jgi:hypothetical protein
MAGNIPSALTTQPLNKQVPSFKRFAGRFNPDVHRSAAMLVADQDLAADFLRVEPVYLWEWGSGRPCSTLDASLPPRAAGAVQRGQCRASSVRPDHRRLL